VLIRQAQNPKFKIPADFVRKAREGLASAPLAFEPFYIAARAEEQAGNRAGAITLMEEAFRRRPTFTATRMHLILYYLETQRYGEAFREMDVLMRRSSQVQQVLLPELAKLVADPRGRAAVAELLAREPEWRDAFVAAAARQQIDPADARALFELVRARKPKGDVELERTMVLQAQVSRGEYRAARDTALAALAPADRAANARLFDGRFAGLKVPKPFGWTLQDNEIGRAERASESGKTYLDVSYFGGRELVLAEQLLALGPGRYTLRSVARRDGTHSGGAVAWQVVCQPGANVLATVDLIRAASNPTSLAGAFTVPASGCAGQQLRLLAQPGDVSSTINLQIEAVELAQ
jgi:tetratricopeptide (TPR) repeat protein